MSYNGYEGFSSIDYCQNKDCSFREDMQKQFSIFFYLVECASHAKLRVYYCNVLFYWAKKKIISRYVFRESITVR